MNTILMGKRLLAGNLPNPLQRGLHRVRHRLAIYGVSLLCMLAIHTANAAETGAEYQSSFNGYKPMTADGPADWKVTNQHVTANGQQSDSTDHSQYSMHEAMGQPSLKAGSQEDMAAMDHGQVDHSKDKTNHSSIHHDHSMHGHTMAPMPAMGHDTETGVSHEH